MVKSRKSGIRKRRMMFGVGVNDSDYIVTANKKKNRAECLYFRCWRNMLMRCYYEGFQKRKPSYKGCAVCDEWLTFTVFKRWMITQDWEGKQIDKDIKVKGNKVYGPDSCSFVTNSENTAEYCAKSYSLTGPGGESVTLFNLRAFCRDNNLALSSMQKVVSGNQEQHRGWWHTTQRSRDRNV